MDHRSPGCAGGPGGNRRASSSNAFDATVARPAGCVSPVLQAAAPLPRRLSSSCSPAASPRSLSSSSLSGHHPQRVRQLHLRGGIGGFGEAPPEPRRQLLGAAAHQPSRSGLLVDHTPDDLIRNVDTLPQQLHEWDELRETARQRRAAAPVKFFHGTRTPQRPAQYVETVTQAKRQHEHRLHCMPWVASLRSPTASSSSSSPASAATSAADSPRGRGDSPAGASASNGTAADREVAAVTVTLADLLLRMQVVSGSRAFCNAEDFEAILLGVGIVGFDDPLVRTVARLCPISGDGVINFTPLYAACDEAGQLPLLTPHHHQHGGTPGGTRYDGNVADSSPLLPSAMDTVPSAVLGGGGGSAAVAAVAAAAASAGGEAAGQPAAGSAPAAGASGGAAASAAEAAAATTAVCDTPAKSADLFPVHNFANTPLPAGTPAPGGPGAGLAVLSPTLTQSAASAAGGVATVSLVVEL